MSAIPLRVALAFLVIVATPAVLTAQPVATYRSAIVALTDDVQLRTRLENDLAAAARARDYDAVTSYDIEPNVARLDGRPFVRALAARGVQAVLMLRPAAIGPGSSLESVRGEVPDTVYRNMQRFAKQRSSPGTDGTVAVVHMAIYILTDGDAVLISSGAVWLDEAVPDREEGIERLQNLILANVDAARPAIRQRLGLPPLP